MKLTLKIENYDFLDDGGPLEISVEGRGILVGRDGAMDWTLPDPARHISSQHFEITFQNGVFWLNDTSTNGTYLQGHSHRVESPYQLAHMDRLQVGHYIIVVVLEGAAAGWDGAAPDAAPAVAATGADPWNLGGGAAEPINVTPAAQDENPWRGDFGDNFLVNPDPPATPTPPPSPAPTPSPEASGGSPFGAVEAPAPAPAPVAPPPVPPAAPPAAAPVAPAPVPPAPQATEELKALLGARAATKQSVKSGSRTMMGQTDNNPLKFMPDAVQAMDVMFINPRPGYLNGTSTLVEAFGDIKRHQMAVYSAIQPALALEDLSPEAIESRSGGGGALSVVGGGKRSRNWEVYVERWDAKTHPYENGMLDVFLAYFAEAYDASIKASGGK